MTSDTATVIQILHWYDYPELILLKKGVSEFILAVRSGDLKSSPNTYIGASMTHRRLRDYASCKCDLRFALLHANLRRYWKFTYVASQDSVNLAKVKRSDPEVATSIPETGLFAVDHDEVGIFKGYVPNTSEEFNVDGNWDLGDFSHFYGQVEDIYYIISDIDRYDDTDITVDEKEIITGAFDRSWDGGGSYVAFYKKVANDNDYHAPLRVSGIEYHSPGYVRIRANREPFDNLMLMLNMYSENGLQARKAYSALSKFMSQNKLNRSVARSFVSDEMKRNIASLANNLDNYMPGVNFNALLDMTERNHVVAAKVLLSVFRRVQKLFRYFDEGRVKHSKIRLAQNHKTVGREEGDFNLS